MNDDDVRAFLASVTHEERRNDALQMLELMTEVTGCEAKMWGKSIVGFGSYAYTYASGHTGEWMAVGFSPRKSALSIYLMTDLASEEDLLSQLGPFKHGKSCLNIKRLSAIHIDVLKRLIKRCYDRTVSDGGAS